MIKSIGLLEFYTS